MDADGSTHGEQAATTAARAAADCVLAGRSRQRRRRGRRASVGVVDDVARLQMAGATSRQCPEHDGNARHDMPRRRITWRRWSAPYHGVVPQLTGDS